MLSSTLPRVTYAADFGAARYRPRRRRDIPLWAAVALIAGAHAALFASLLQVDAFREQVAEAAPLFVSFITPPRPVEAPPPPPPQAREMTKERRILATARPAPVQAPPIVDAPIAVAPPTPAAPAEPAAVPVAAVVAAVVANAAPAVSVTPPRFTGAGLDNPQAEYPTISRRLKESGRVQMHVLVGTGGTAERVDLEKSSGFERLDESALAAVRRWRFIPAHQGDQAVAQWVNVSIPFELTRS